MLCEVYHRNLTANQPSNFGQGEIFAANPEGCVGIVVQEAGFHVKSSSIGSLWSAPRLAPR